jgi:hypothetical protein
MGKAALASAIVLLSLTGRSVAQDKKTPEKHDASALYYTLRDVINAGAKVFNEQGDHAGCFRLYQGSLLTVRPFLPPDQQKSVDEAFAQAEKQGSYAERAFALRKVLDEIRAAAKPGAAEPKKTAGKKTDKTNKSEKNDKGSVNGKITYRGAPVIGGYFVTLVSTEGKKLSSAIQKDGTFQFKTPITPGEYRVVVEPIPGEASNLKLPARYRNETTSSLRISDQAGKQQVELNLVD